MTQKAISFSRIAPCLFSIIVDYMGFGLVYPLVTAMFTQVPETVFPHIESASARDFYLGLSYLLYPLFMFFGASFLGDMSDIYGRKKELLLSMGGILVSFLLMAYGIYVHSIELFLVGRGASGLMAGSQPLCMAAIADLSTAENKARNMSLVTLTNCIGLVLGPFIGGVFTETYFLQWAGFSFPFFLAAVFALVGFGLIYFLFEETFVPNREKTVKFTRPITIFVDAFKHHHICLLVSVVFTQLLGLMIYYQIMGIYLRELFHYSSAQLGYFYAFVGLFFALGILIVLPRALKRWQLEEIVGSGFLIMGICAMVSVLYTNEIYLWALVIPFAASHSIGFSALAAIFSNAADEKNQGWMMGVVAATFAVASVIAGLSTNLLPFTGARGLIGLGGAAGILSSWVMFYYAKKHRPHRL